MHQTLEKKINTYFPNRFAFMITKTNGKPLLKRGAGLVGKACRTDINLIFSECEKKGSTKKERAKKQNLCASQPENQSATL